MRPGPSGERDWRHFLTVSPYRPVRLPCGRDPGPFPAPRRVNSDLDGHILCLGGSHLSSAGLLVVVHLVAQRLFPVDGFGLGRDVKRREAKLILAGKLKTDPRPLQLPGEKQQSPKVLPDELPEDLLCPYCSGPLEIWGTSKTCRACDGTVLELDPGGLEGSGPQSYSSLVGPEAPRWDLDRRPVHM